MNGSGPEPESKEDNVAAEKEAEEEVKERKASYGSFGRYAPYLKEAEGSDAPSAVQTLRMDGCNLRAFVLEAFGQSSLEIREQLTDRQQPVFEHLISRTFPYGVIE